MSDDRIAIPIENDFGSGVAVASRKLVEKLMSEERKEFDLSIVNWWCVIVCGQARAAFVSQLQAEAYAQDLTARWYRDFPADAIQVNQITRKIPFE
jgi:hypothetical protein